MIMALNYCPGNQGKNSRQLASGFRFDLGPPWHTAEWQPLEYRVWLYIYIYIYISCIIIYWIFLFHKVQEVWVKIREKQMQWQQKKNQTSLENQTKMREVKPKHTESEFPLRQHISKTWITLNSKQRPHWYNSSKRHWMTLPPSILWDFLGSLDILG